jgi:hypothetical protein
VEGEEKAPTDQVSMPAGVCCCCGECTYIEPIKDIRARWGRHLCPEGTPFGLVSNLACREGRRGSQGTKQTSFRIEGGGRKAGLVGRDKMCQDCLGEKGMNKSMNVC